MTRSSCPRPCASVRPSGGRRALLCTLRAASSAALLLASIGNAGCGGDAPPAPPRPAPAAAPPAPAPAGGLKVVVLGDSLAAGLGLPADQAWPARIAEGLREMGRPVELVNAGLSGDTTAGGLARVDWLLQQRPALLVVELGGNDLLRGLPLDQTRQNLLGICEKGKAAGAQVLMVAVAAPPTVGPAHQAAFDALFPDVARACGAALSVDFLSPVMGQPELIQADGLHPTAEGQARLAAGLLPAVAAALPPG